MTRVFRWFGCFVLITVSACAAEIKASRHAPAEPDWLVSLEHTPRQPHSGQEVQIQARIRNGVTNAVLLYQVVDPGAYIEQQDPAFLKNWIALPMKLTGREAEASRFQVALPGDLQKNRRLVRYRLKAQDTAGHEQFAPAAQAAPPNRAYFVYDGIPAWSGAIDPRSSDPRLAKPIIFPTSAMQRIQAYYLLGKRRSIENATWREQSGSKEYKYTGTLVVDGEVFDHVWFRARGGVWRYAMGKNMWKFALPGEHGLQAKDDFGHQYPVAWTKINLRACIQQGDYGQRGEQGMFESVGFRLFNLAGVPAPNTHWIQLRIVDEPNETPPDQYRGDFWGLYLAIENEDGRFLKAHHLGNGNLFKMMGGSGELQHHAAGAVTNLSDLFGFMSGYRGPNLNEEWWQRHFDLTNYYSYLAISECIHHYDVSDGKNYDYYHDPQTDRWRIIPWDIDLTWADNMYGSGADPFKRRILAQPVFRIQYQNRLREIRDLLFNSEEAGAIIDEYALVISDPSGVPCLAEADRRKWDYHPIMAMGMKAGQGLFYQSTPSGNFHGMVQVMKDYVKTRGAWIDAGLLNDPSIPATPKVARSGPQEFLADQLRFTVSEYKGAKPFAAVSWRLAEVASKQTPRSSAQPTQAPREITSLWESAELTDALTPLAIPAGIAQPNHSYRVRARMKDATGRWSHWSAPIEFLAR
jgi:hypothetical protein